jgi:hypothetical protein
LILRAQKSSRILSAQERHDQKMRAPTKEAYDFENLFTD